MILIFKGLLDVQKYMLTKKIHLAVYELSS